MLNIKIVIVKFTLAMGFLTFLSSYAKSDVAVENFCRSNIQKSGNQQGRKPGLFDLLTLRFKGKTAVENYNLNSSQQFNGGQNYVPTVKLLFVLLPSLQLTINEEENAKRARKQLVRMRKSLGRNFFKKINKSTNIEVCKSLLSKYPQKLDIINEINQLWNRSRDLLKREADQQAYDLVMKKARAFEIKGFQVISKLSYIELFRILKSYHTTEVLDIAIVAHAKPSGEIVDAKENVIPQSFFKRISETVKRISVFSCYQKDVIKKYDLDNSNRGFEYFYPQTKERFEKIYGENKTPLIALKKILKVHSENLIQTSSREKMLCRIDVRYSNPKKEMELYINGYFVSDIKAGFHQEIFEIPCDLIGKKNFIEVFSRNSENVKFGSEEYSFQIALTNKWGEIEDVILKNYFSSVSQSRHIVSKKRIEF